MDFTVAKYKELVDRINDAGIPVYGINDWMAKRPEYGIFMRHDVDRLPGNSLKIAELEYNAGLQTTYYFRIVRGSFDPDIIQKIAALGHEIGYHYEDLSLAGGNYDKAINLFEKNLNKLKGLSEISTVAMHGRPMSKYDNRDLWNRFNVTDFGLNGEAFLDIDYSEVYYFTDTGRNWNNRYNLRDRTNSRQAGRNIGNTDELADFITEHPKEKTALITHPERWSGSTGQWVVQWSKDTLINQAKVLINASRKIINRNN